MKTITGFVSVGVAALCVACATHEPVTSGAAARTVSALPQPQTYSVSQLAALRKTPGGEYPGYQRITVDGQARYCRKNRATGADTESTVVCITEAQLWAEQLRAQELASTQEQELRGSGTQQVQNQETWRQQAQTIAVNNPVTVVPMARP